MIQIFPAIDIIDGKCVRLTKGDYDQKTVYNESPVDMAMRYKDAGVKRLHIVDLDGAKASSPMNLKVLEEMATRTELEFEFGGGLKTSESIRSAFNAGADYAICGSIAVNEPETFSSWFDEYGADRLILGADIRDGKVSTHGWLKDSQYSVNDLIIKYADKGLKQVICTDISKDGMLQGTNTSLYEELQADFPDIDMIVSGGVSSVDDILNLNSKGLRAVIVGKAIYEGRISLKELAELIEYAD